MQNSLTGDENKARIVIGDTEMTVSKNTRTTINKSKLEKDGLLEKYATNGTSYTLRIKEIKEKEGK